MPRRGELLLDANAVIAFLANDAAFHAKFGQIAAYLPSTVAGELYFGAYKSARVAENVVRVDRLVAASAVLVVDAGTARAYGSAKQRLKAKGQMIPENDVWIAAMALQRDLTLVTRDHHFNAVDGLTTSAW